MKRYLLTLLLFPLIISCSNTNKGLIIKRGECEKGSKKQYLTNKSKSKIFTFTLRRTTTNKVIIVKNGKKATTNSNEIEIEIYNLYPGQEIELSCEKYYEKTQEVEFVNKYDIYTRNYKSERENVGDRETWTTNEYEVVGAVMIENRLYR